MKKKSYVFTGGTLIDGTGALPIPNSAIVVNGPKVVDVGPSKKVNFPKEAEILDVKGKTVIPGFIDSHTHFILMGVRIQSTLDLSKAKSLAEVVDQVSVRLSEMPAGSWPSPRTIERHCPPDSVRQSDSPGASALPRRL